MQAKITALGEAAGSLAERAYAASNAEAGAAPEPETAEAAAEGDAVDAEFEEVKDDNK